MDQRSRKRELRAVPAGKLFTSVSIELECQGPATRQHNVQVYYYIAPGVLCEQQLIEPPLYPQCRLYPAPRQHRHTALLASTRYVLDTI